MEVIGTAGRHVGTVDKVDGNRIKLTRADDPDGTRAHHHCLPLDAVASGEEGRVKRRPTVGQAAELAIGGGTPAPEAGLGGAAGMVDDEAPGRISGHAGGGTGGTLDRRGGFGRGGTRG
jgi:hypothetical protein